MISVFKSKKFEDLCLLIFDDKKNVNYKKLESKLLELGLLDDKKQVYFYVKTRGEWKAKHRKYDACTWCKDGCAKNQHPRYSYIIARRCIKRCYRSIIFFSKKKRTGGTLSVFGSNAHLSVHLLALHYGLVMQRYGLVFY